jgi:hypothetical protein
MTLRNMCTGLVALPVLVLKALHYHSSLWNTLGMHMSSLRYYVKAAMVCRLSSAVAAVAGASTAETELLLLWKHTDNADTEKCMVLQATTGNYSMHSVRHCIVLHDAEQCIWQCYLLLHGDCSCISGIGVCMQCTTQCTFTTERCMHVFSWVCWVCQPDAESMSLLEIGDRNTLCRRYTRIWYEIRYEHYLVQSSWNYVQWHASSTHKWQLHFASCYCNHCSSNTSSSSRAPSVAA